MLIDPLVQMNYIMISLHQLEMEADKYFNKGSVQVCYVLVYTYPMVYPMDGVYVVKNHYSSLIAAIGRHLTLLFLAFAAMGMKIQLVGDYIFSYNIIPYRLIQY